MIENKNLKKVKILYVVVIGLIFLLGGMFYYFQNKIDDIKKGTEINSELSINILKRLNNVIELNYLDTDNYVYKINSSDWKETLKNETALTLDDLDNYKVNNVITRQSKNMNSDNLSEFTIIIDMLNNSTFNDFTKLIYEKINNIFILTNNDTSKVESFKEGKGYYDITSFEEATYNNMYYDYMKTLNDGTTSGPKVKVKILYLEETNQIKMEINKF